MSLLDWQQLTKRKWKAEWIVATPPALLTFYLLLNHKGNYVVEKLAKDTYHCQDNFSTREEAERYADEALLDHMSAAEAYALLLRIESGTRSPQPS